MLGRFKTAVSKAVASTKAAAADKKEQQQQQQQQQRGSGGGDAGASGSGAAAGASGSGSKPPRAKKPPPAPRYAAPKGKPERVTSRVHARIGLLGNPSDGFFGKTVALAISNFYADVTLAPLPAGRGIEFVPHPKHDRLAFPGGLPELVGRVETEGYYGGVRLLMVRAVIMMMMMTAMTAAAVAMVGDVWGQQEGGDRLRSAALAAESLHSV